ncbi:hypothetical protein OBV_04240 [Oscillibacter valericigenes Sjm18-20]|nr:hypothetical protein OBV_04240 [Oscillibacter valericigenes Sjm18-20]
MQKKNSYNKHCQCATGNLNRCFVVNFSRKSVKNSTAKPTIGILCARLNFSRPEKRYGGVSLHKV